MFLKILGFRTHVTMHIQMLVIKYITIKISLYIYDDCCIVGMGMRCEVFVNRPKIKWMMQGIHLVQKALCFQLP